MANDIFRANSRLKSELGEHGAKFISHVAGSIERILPHVEVAKWREISWTDPGSVWASAERKEIRFTISFGNEDEENGRSLSTVIRRRGASTQTLDQREYNICKQISERSSAVASDTGGRTLTNLTPETVEALRSSFDESVIAQHIQDHFGLEMPVGPIFVALHRLSEQTYENKALVFGCLLGDRRSRRNALSRFPTPFLDSKRYKALSDGFRTAYRVSIDGQISDFVELSSIAARELTEKHYYPDWAESLAQASLSGECAIALTRQGDILVFDRGVLRFTYRYGKWQYWNHAHVIGLLRHKARAQKVPPHILGRVVGAIYRASLDVSFRRSGGLFVILHNRNALHEIVRQGDAIGDSERDTVDDNFDEVIQQHKMQSLPRAVAVELAALDGAIVLSNSGEILAYGAVLQPKRHGRIRGTEGSRTKAAIGSSNYGLAVKISSDGDISVYSKGEKFISV